MKKAKFKSSYTDLNDGTKVKIKAVVKKVDLTKDLGDKFVFVDVEQTEDDRVVRESISFRLKDIPKLIKALKQVSK